MQRANQTGRPSPPQGDRLPEQTHDQQPTVTRRERGDRVRVTVPDEAPLIARYEDQSSRTYLVRDAQGQQVLVPKARVAAEPFAEEPGQQMRTSRLLRWSTAALCALVLGGLGGVVVGLPVVVIAATRLADHARAIHRWRREHVGTNGLPPVPATATTELTRLRAAFWQGLVALAFGAVLLLFLTGRVL